mmetsp:Transcript_52565/g.87230  ORF Transcript_52565/g.87230 Transcript_52565/m.87230 type:complete len:203 (-) Transcript_52565:544-1152(-)
MIGRVLDHGRHALWSTDDKTVIKHESNKNKYNQERGNIYVLKCNPISLNLASSIMKSSCSIFCARSCSKPVASRTEATSSRTPEASTLGTSAFEASASIGCIALAAPLDESPCRARWVFKFSASNCNTCFCLNIAERVLFFLLKQSRTIPSHSTKFTGGGGLSGSMRTTDESTLGGGRNEFFETFIRWSTFASNCVLTASLQ